MPIGLVAEHGGNEAVETRHNGLQGCHAGIMLVHGCRQRGHKGREALQLRF
jgi:hypothetical protein